MNTNKRVLWIVWSIETAWGDISWMFEVSIIRSEEDSPRYLWPLHTQSQVDEKPDKAELGLPRPLAQPPVTSHAPGLSPVEKKPWLMVPSPILPPLPTLNFSVCQVRSQEKSLVIKSCVRLNVSEFFHLWVKCLNPSAPPTLNFSVY